MEEINSKESNKALYISLGILVVFMLGLFTNGFGFLAKSSLTGRTTSEFIPLEIGDSPVLGDANAPVTIYEFSDFSCPFCAAAAGYNEEMKQVLESKIPGWEAPLPRINNEYVKTGKVKIVFKYFPGHGGAKAAQLVALCLNEQGLFWKFADKAFELQKGLNSFSEMKTLAESIGADMEKLNACLNSGKHNPQLEEDTIMGNSAGVTGTPSFIINGKLIAGAESFSYLKKIIDAELQ